MLRKFAFGIILAAFGLGASNEVNAQAFEKGATYLNLGLTGSNYWHIDVQNNWPGYYGSFRPGTVGGLTLQMEWGIHQYVGLGFYTGVQGGIGRYAWYGPYNYGELAVPLGIVANFHFYQLIEDKTSKDIHGDKLDIYAGINAGSGIGFFPRPNWVTPLFFVGPQVGAKYYVTPNIALGGEVGYGKSFVTGGVTFKL